MSTKNGKNIAHTSGISGSSLGRLAAAPVTVYPACALKLGTLVFAKLDIEDSKLENDDGMGNGGAQDSGRSDNKLPWYSFSITPHDSEGCSWMALVVRYCGNGMFGAANIW